MVFSISLLTMRALLLLFYASVTFCRTGESLPTASSAYGNGSRTNNDVFRDIEGSAVHANFDLNCTEIRVEKEYVLLENGSLILPGDRSTYEYQSFYLRNDTAYICAQTDETSEATTESYHFSGEFLSCGHVLIEPHEYELLKNGSVYIAMYSRMYESTDYYIRPSGVYVCVPQYEEMKANMSHFEQVELDELSEVELNKFPESFAYVTYTGLFVSIVSLASHLIVFCAVSSVRNLPGCCLASLSLSLLLAYLCFVGIAFAQSSKHCSDLGLCVYYFFLTSFFWMNAIAFDVWRSFRVVMRELRISSHRVPWRRFLAYSVYSWLVPALLTVLVKMADVTDVLPADYRPKFGRRLCWFGNRKALLVFFAVPLCCVMLLNAMFFLDVTYVISRATMRTSHSHEANMKRRFFMFMRLALIMGLTWIVGIVAGYVDNEILWYLFVVLNTLQGLFILVVFSCSSKVKGLFCKKLGMHSNKRGSTSVRTISQMSGAI